MSRKRVPLVLIAICCAVCLCGGPDSVPARAAAAAPGPAIRSAVVKVGPETLTVDVIVNGRLAPAVDGPIKVVVTLPAGTAGKIVSTDRGFNRHGWSISFVRGTKAGEGAASVTVPARKRRIQTEIDIASSSGWAVGIPSTTNQPTAIPYYV